ncbi:MAG: phosphotransferase [Myxococcota bacterium]|nr:phosphotransferase [Myxococcota bacterium]
MKELEGLTQHVFSLLEAEGLAPADMAVFRPISDLIDNPIKLAIRDAQGDCLGILQWSPPGAVHAVADAVRRAEAIRRRLGDDLGQVVLAATLEGEFQSRTFALYPWQRTLSELRVVSRVHNWLYAPSVLGWLNAVHAQSFSALAESDYPTRIFSPLDRLASESGLSTSLRDVVRQVAADVESGDFAPKVGPVHNDLWRGNILLPLARSSGRDSGRPFVLIDWGASTVAGFPLWDLLRVLRSLRIPDRVARRILRRECQALGMSLQDGHRSVFLALADLGVNRNEFPLELHLQAVEQSHAYFQLLAS